MIAREVDRQGDGPRGIRQRYRPGFTATEMTDKTPDEAEVPVQQIPLRRGGKPPEDVAKVVVRLTRRASADRVIR